MVILDVSSISSVTSFFVLATGASTPHLKALAAEVERVLKASGVTPYRRAGASESAWLVVDYVHVVVHVFSEEMRDYYSLERLWRDAPKVED